MSEPFEGHEPRECGEHRTVGPHRAWCFDCTEWCYPRPELACKGCELPQLRAIAVTVHAPRAGRPWRTGRKVGRTIYVQIGDEPSDHDLLIGVMDTPHLADAAVTAYNASVTSPNAR